MFWRAGDRTDAGEVPFDADRPAVRAAQRDVRRFDPLYRKYVAQVYSFALYELRDATAAEDATEQVFLRALDALPRFEERGEGADSTFRVWLFQIARRVLSNERRSEARHPQALLEAAHGIAARDDVEAQVTDRELVERAWRAVDRQPAERRRALILRFVEEMTTREIAAIMGRSEGAVRVLVHRGVRAVAAELERDEEGTADGRRLVRPVAGARIGRAHLRGRRRGTDA